MPKATFQVFSDVNTKVVGGYVEKSGGAGRVSTERVENVMGSSAGAGSGEFHMYLNSRNREKDRMENIDAQRKQEEENRAFQEKLALNKKLSELRTEKNSKKRQKAKARKDNFKKEKKLKINESGEATKEGIKGETDSGNDESEEEDLPQEY